MVEKPTNYHSFLIRLWKIKQEDTFTWRASLENPQTEEIFGFKNLQALFEYLESLTTREANDD